MSEEIRIYIEGGGDNKDTKGSLRAGFGAFLRELRESARAKGIHWEPIVCGGGSETYKDYCTGLKTHPKAFNVLLLDAEEPVHHQSPWAHLAARKENKCKNPGVEDNRCHLMTQIMEAWFIADRERLRDYFGPGFNENALPRNDKVEEIAKERLDQGLKDATRATKKRRYKKTRDAPEILKIIRPAVVRKRAPCCARLFRELELNIEGNVAREALPGAPKTNWRSVTQ